jgi:hypothetical protein
MPEALGVIRPWRGRRDLATFATSYGCVVRGGETMATTPPWGHANHDEIGLQERQVWGPGWVYQRRTGLLASSLAEYLEPTVGHDSPRTSSTHTQSPVESALVGLQ